MSTFPASDPSRDFLLFDDAIKLASFSVTLAVLSEDGNAWYAAGKMAPELPRTGEAILKVSAALTTDPTHPLNVLAYFTEGNVHVGETTTTQPYYAGYAASPLSLQIVRGGVSRLGLGTPPSPNIPALRADAYSGLDAIVSPKSKPSFQVGLYVVGRTYVGVAAGWVLDMSYPTPGTTAVYMITFYVAPKVKQIPGQPHPLKPGEAVEGRASRVLKIDGLKNKRN